MSDLSCMVTINAKKEELQQHGSSLFPIAYYEEYTCDGNIPWHWHDDLEIIWITSGSMRINVDSASFLIPEGKGIFINAGKLHSVETGSTANACLHSIVFHPRLIGDMDSIYWIKYIEPLIQDKNIPYILFDKSLDWHQMFFKTVESIWHCLDEKLYGYEFYVRNSLSELTLLISKHHSTCETVLSLCTIRSSARIKQMIQYIQDNYGEEVTLSNLAKAASISESEVLRCFHQTVHTTPTKYLTLYRIQQAARMLKYTDKNATEIAYECGFKSSSYFGKLFREIMKCTPVNYRNTIC